MSKINRKETRVNEETEGKETRGNEEKSHIICKNGRLCDWA